MTANFKAKNQLPFCYALKFVCLFCTMCILYYFGWRPSFVFCIHFLFLSVVFLGCFPLVRTNRPGGQIGRAHV